VGIQKDQTKGQTIFKLLATSGRVKGDHARRAMCTHQARPKDGAELEEIGDSRQSQRNCITVTD
jgi:hypothetical protein